MRWRQFCFHRQRHPNIRRLPDGRAEKLLRGNADYFVSRLVNSDGFADRRRVAAESALPPSIAHNYDLMPAGGLVICLSKGAPKSSTYPQHRKVSARDRLYIHLFHFTSRPVRVDSSMYVPGYAQERRHFCEDPRTLPHLLIKRIGEEITASVREAISQAQFFAFPKKH